MKTFKRGLVWFCFVFILVFFVSVVSQLFCVGVNEMFLCVVQYLFLVLMTRISLAFCCHLNLELDFILSWLFLYIFWNMTQLRVWWWHWWRKHTSHIITCSWWLCRLIELTNDDRLQQLQLTMIRCKINSKLKVSNFFWI